MVSSSPELRINKLSRGGKYHEWAAQIRAQLIELDLDEYLMKIWMKAMPPPRRRRDGARLDCNWQLREL